MSFGDNFPVCHSLILFNGSLVSWLLKQKPLILVPQIIKVGRIWWPSLFYGRVLWPKQRLKIFSFSTNTPSIYMNTVSASRVTQADSVVWRPQSCFHLSSACSCYPDCSYGSVLFMNSVSTSLLLPRSFYYKLLLLSLLCAAAAFCIGSVLLFIFSCGVTWPSPAC